MTYTILAGEKGNYAEVTATGKLKVETDAEITLTSIETEIQGTLDVKLMSSDYEYYWLSTGTAPTTGVPLGAIGIEIDTVADTMEFFTWDGSTWKPTLDFALGTSATTSIRLAAGTALVGKVGIDQVTANANEVVTKTGSVTTATLAAGTSNIGNVTVRGSDAAAYESVTVADSAIGFTAGTYGTNTRAIITCETAQIRFRIDGTDPTAAEGHLLNPGDTLELDSLADITAFRAIRTGSVSGVIKVSYSGVA